VRLTDRTYGQLLLVSHFDKRHYSAPTFLRPFVETERPKSVVPLASWHRVTVVLDPTGVRATIGGKPTPAPGIDPASALRTFRTVHPLDGEVPAPLGAGVGLFTFGGDTAFRNATIRRPR
jgi:hypothetical protein